MAKKDNEQTQDQDQATAPTPDAAPEAPTPEAPVVTPVAAGEPFYEVKQWFNHFGRELFPGDKINPKDLARCPEGTVSRRVENGFLVFVAG